MSNDPTVTTELDVAAELVESARATVQYHADAVAWCDAVAVEVAAGIAVAQQRLSRARQDYAKYDTPPPVEPEILDQWKANREAAYQAAGWAEEVVKIAENDAQLAYEAASKLHPNVVTAKAALAEFEALHAKEAKKAKAKT